MIPKKLTLTGFLSYRAITEIDFDHFDIACIVGDNGAGKSSILDAMTWVLFGQARMKGDAIINSHPTTETAVVDFTFDYESNTYWVTRIKPRGKTTVLEFRIKSGDEWQPLTESSIRETQAEIERVIGLDYETFINASFFLQGKADQFTQQRPGDRKRILASILGLEIWETYRKRASIKRRSVENEIYVLDGHVQGINLELENTIDRVAGLDRAKIELEELRKARELLEVQLKDAKKIRLDLDTRKTSLAMADREIKVLDKSRQEAGARLITRTHERKGYNDVLKAKEYVMSRHRKYQELVVHEQQMERDGRVCMELLLKTKEPLSIINMTEKSMDALVSRLSIRENEIEDEKKRFLSMEKNLENTNREIDFVNTKIRGYASEKDLIAEQDDHKAHIIAYNSMQLELVAKNKKMNVRIISLLESPKPECPLCEQKLTASKRDALIETLAAEEKNNDQKITTAQGDSKDTYIMLSDVKTLINDRSSLESMLSEHKKTLERYETKISQSLAVIKEWEDVEDDGYSQLQEIRWSLENDDYCEEQREEIAQINKELNALGYDKADHDMLSAKLDSFRDAEDLMLTLEKAKSAVEPLNREIEEISKQLAQVDEELTSKSERYVRGSNEIREEEIAAEDPGLIESELDSHQRRENVAFVSVGAAEQKVETLRLLKSRKSELRRERIGHAIKVEDYKILEQAFGKSGIPALLIEQALPQIEAKANTLLDQLSGGDMTVRFVTQKSYKDKKRDDLQETLDIQISDNDGVRDYEMFSGGEAFRVNFAIRLALSEILTQRAGARLQTLVIDEGFGSQDVTGRDRLIEAIGSIKSKFKKILIITHINELKDMFSTQIVVEKTDQGSTLSIV